MARSSLLTNMHRTSSFALTLTLVCSVVVGNAGCGKPGAALAPVTGRVTLDDKPLAGVTVCFVRDGAPQWSFGQTDADGKFALTTIAEKDGAYVGLNQVTVSQPTGSSAAPSKSAAPGVPNPDEYFKQLAKSAEKKSAVVPEKYQQLGASGLTAEIKAGPNVVDLPLSTTGVAK